MQEFLYFGQSGHSPVSGIVSAGNSSEARQTIEAAGTSIQTLTRILPAKEKLFWDWLDIIIVLIGQGYHITDALRILESETDKQIRNISSIILRRLETGQNLVQSLSHTFKSLPPETKAVLQAGETTGLLERSCKLLLSKHKSALARQRQMRIILAYPTVVGVATFFVAWILFDTVLPNLQSTFSKPDTLPYLSQFILSLSGQFGAFIEILIWSLITILVPIVVLQRIQNVKYHLDRFWLKLPFIRRLILSNARGRYFEILALGMDSRLPLIQALQLATATLSNKYLSQLCTEACRQIEQGQSFVKSITPTLLLTNRELSQISAAENSSHLEETVTNIAVEIEQSRHSFAALIAQITGPIFIIFVGGIIFLVALAIVVPMLAMQSQIEGILQ